MPFDMEIEVTEAEVEYALERQSSAFDADDLTEIAAENAGALLEALKNRSPSKLFEILDNERKKSIARRASYEVYGDAGVIKDWVAV